MAGDGDECGEVCVCSGACHVYNSVVATDTEATCVSQQAAPQLLLLRFHSIISRRVCLYNVRDPASTQAAGRPQPWLSGHRHCGYCLHLHLHAARSRMLADAGFGVLQSAGQLYEAFAQKPPSMIFCCCT
jgi:hypothetical protein